MKHSNSKKFLKFYDLQHMWGIKMLVRHKFYKMKFHD